MNSIAEIQAECRNYGSHTPEYYYKMIHLIPFATVVHRSKFILDKCRGKKVLNIGSAVNDIQRTLKTVASEVTGVDKIAGPNTDIVRDLDQNPYLYHLSPDKYDIIVAGEVIEHLANPGRFLEAMRYFGCPLLITTPNAMNEESIRCVRQGFENVDRDHVAYYSYKTLKTLIERYGYKLLEFYWCTGKRNVSEGIVAVVG